MYGDNGLKSNFGGNNNRHRDNVYAYVGQCFYGNPCTSCATPSSLSRDEYFGNTCVFRAKKPKVGYFSDCGGLTAGVKVGNNSVFSEDGSLQVCTSPKDPAGISLAQWPGPLYVGNVCALEHSTE